MAEEQRWQEGHRLCANNCGFFGSPATNDLCSKCYRDLRLKEHNASSAMIAVKNSLSTATTTTSSVVLSHPQQQQQQQQQQESSSSVAAVVVEEVVRANRCGECRKKVGLATGFRCRCGSTYCGAHRYPESHACGFDFKSAGKEAIARANPLVKAHKLSHRI